MVGHGERLALIVGDVDEGDADALLDGSQLRPHMLAQLEIERGERFVEQQHMRLGTERPRHRDTLLLAARKLMRELLAVARQSDELEQLVGAAAPLGLALALHLHGEGDVLPHPHQGKQCQVLEDQCGRTLIRADAGHVVAADPDPAAARFLEARDGAQDGGLAAARRTEE